jgi:hypothetical protein
VVVFVEGCNSSEVKVRKVHVEYDEALGAYHYDMLLFGHFSDKCGAQKVGTIKVKMWDSRENTSTC